MAVGPFPIAWGAYQWLTLKKNDPFPIIYQLQMALQLWMGPREYLTCSSWDFV